MHRSSLNSAPSQALVGAASLALALALGACGSDSQDQPESLQTAASGSVFNAADVAFATDMIPHHAQALEMVAMTQERDLRPELSRIVEQIRGAQAPEVETMVGWLTDWDQEVPETSLDHVNAEHDGHEGGSSSMDDMDMPGMMSGAEMDALAGAPDVDFQSLWLTMMIEHHRGAIDMAELELEDGHFADAQKLAESIASGQAAEIEQMEALLAAD